MLTMKLPENTDIVAVVVAIVLFCIPLAWALIRRPVNRRQRERAAVKGLLRFLAGRRVLSSPYAFEHTGECIAAVQAIRERSEKVIETVDDSAAMPHLQGMQMACR